MSNLINVYVSVHESAHELARIVTSQTWASFSARSISRAQLDLTQILMSRTWSKSGSLELDSFDAYL
jgi:hypothetical protein